MTPASGSNSNEMTAASTFSYAQAAKRHVASPSTTLPNPATRQTQAAAQSTTAPESAPDSSDVVPTADSRPRATSEKQEIDSNASSERDLRPETTHERRPEPRQDDNLGRQDRPWRRSEEGTRSSSTATRSVDEQESRRPRKGKKSKASPEKQSNDQSLVTDGTKESVQDIVKVELSEAPIPSVNIWHQRKEQQAKVKPSLGEVPSNGNAHDGEAKKPAKPSAPAIAARENPPTNGAKSSRNTTESGRSDRNSNRVSRPADKEDKSELPPPVGDAASWPTPEIAINQEQKKPSTATHKPMVSQEKESQDDASQSKRQKEKWVAYDYVPSVSFETQLPQMRNSKPRSGARHSNNQKTSLTSGQSPDKAVSGPAHASKPIEARDRAKDSGSGSASGSNGATSQPPPFKRGPVDASNGAKEQKKAAAQPSNEKNKEAASIRTVQQNGGGGGGNHGNSSSGNANGNGNNTSHRSEGRSERGRGGYRGRGPSHPVNPHSHQHNTANYSNNGTLGGRSQGPYSPPPRQGPHAQGFIPPPRAGRGRSGGANNYHRMSLPNSTSRLPPIQANFPPYEYPMHPLSAVQFTQPPQFIDPSTIDGIRKQIEYYFSIENLCKDMYLRKRMDSNGFVHLHFITAFKRMREVTQDMAIIRAACEVSTEIEYVIGNDEIERLRRRDGWQNFVLPMDDRDEFARNDGPSEWTSRSRTYPYVLPNGAFPLPFGLHPPASFSPPADGQFPQFSDGTSAGHHHPNGLANGNGSTQLSANVPDFAPSGSGLS